MDALILSCGTGGGHNSAGRAVMEELKKRGHHVVMKNPYMLKNPHLSGGIDRTYISTVKHVPKAFGAIYRIGDLYRRLPFRSPVYFINHGMDTVMQRYLTDNRFDLVIMPHLFPAEILTNMKLHGMEIPKTMFIATDYVCIPFTEETDCDAYVIPAPDLSDEFRQRGIKEEKIYPLGIPVGRGFHSGESSQSAKDRLGLSPEKKYILVAGGSMGGGKIEQEAEKLCDYFADYKDIELLIVCGNNRALYDRMSVLARPGMRVIGHTDDMASYMRASSLFITKPGGLSSTEAAVCGVPLFHSSPIPGCETYNAEYFCSRGMSISGDLTDEMLHRALQLIEDEDAAKEMTACQRRWINPEAASDICDLAEKMTNG